MKKIKKVELQCPICMKLGYLSISSNYINKAERGMFAVEISKGLICEHAFIAYIDRNLIVRDSFTADFQVDSSNGFNPQIPWIDQVSKKTLNLDLIKMNLTLPTLSYILKAIFFRKKMILIFEDSFLYDHILNFLNYITRDSFTIDVSIMAKQDYIPHMNLVNDYIVLERNKIIRAKNNILDNKNLVEERRIVQKFLNEYNMILSLITIKNEISKVYIYSRKIIKYIKNIEKPETKSARNLLKHLSNVHGIKIKPSYLSFLLDIVRNYDKVTVSDNLQPNLNIISLL